MDISRRIEFGEDIAGAPFDATAQGRCGLPLSRRGGVCTGAGRDPIIASISASHRITEIGDETARMWRCSFNRQGGSAEDQSAAFGGSVHDLATHVSLAVSGGGLTKLRRTVASHDHSLLLGSKARRSYSSV